MNCLVCKIVSNDIEISPINVTSSNSMKKCVGNVKNYVMKINNYKYLPKNRIISVEYKN
jgi:hypothetical protein